MIGVIQRVKSAKVTVGGKTTGEIGLGLLVLLGVEKDDSEFDMEKLCTKISQLRIFSDDEDKMNLSVSDASGKILLVSQFTLMADCKKGRRPSFIKAASPNFANDIYEKAGNYFREVQNVPCEMGEFGAHMEVSLTNDGPVTIILNSKEL